MFQIFGNLDIWGRHCQLRWSTQKSKDEYKDHLVGWLTKFYGDSAAQCHGIYTNRPWKQIETKKQRAVLDEIHCWQNHLCQIFDLFRLCTNMVGFSVTQDNTSTNANICAPCSSVCSVRPCQQHSDILTSYVAPPSHQLHLWYLSSKKNITPHILS